MGLKGEAHQPRVATVPQSIPQLHLPRLALDLITLVWSGFILRPDYSASQAADENEPKGRNRQRRTCVRFRMIHGKGSIHAGEE